MRNFLVSCLVLGLMSGCSLSSKRVPVASHDLGPMPVAYATSTSYLTGITVSSPEWLNGNQLYYRRLYASPTALKSYARDRWIAPPGELLNRRFSLIKNAQGLKITIELVDFEQRFEAPDRAHSVFSFNVEVFRRGSRQLYGRRFFGFQQENETADAAGAIKSFAELSGRAAHELDNWLAILNESVAE